MGVVGYVVWFVVWSCCVVGWVVDVFVVGVC